MPGLLSTLSSCIGLITIEEPLPSAHGRRRAARKMEARQKNPPKPAASGAPLAAPFPAAAAVPRVERQPAQETQFVYTAQTVQGTQPVCGSQAIPGPQLGYAPQHVQGLSVYGLQPVQGLQPGYTQQPAREPIPEQRPQQRPQAAQQPQVVRGTQPAQGTRPAREPEVSRGRPAAGETRYASNNQSARYARAAPSPRSTPSASTPAATHPMSSDGFTPARGYRQAFGLHREHRCPVHEQSQHERSQYDEPSDNDSTTAQANFKTRDDHPPARYNTQHGDSDPLPEDEWPRDTKETDQHVPYSGGSGPPGLFAYPAIPVFPVFTAPLYHESHPMLPKPTLSPPTYQASRGLLPGNGGETDHDQSHHHSLHHGSQPINFNSTQCCSEHQGPLPANDGQTDHDQAHHHSMHHQPTIPPISALPLILTGPAGPEPPAAPSPSAPSSPGSPRKSKKKRPSTSDIGYIWPKDPRPGNPGRWSRGSRLSDVLTGKGPDMYVGRIGVRPREEVSGKTPVAKKATDRYRWDSEKYWSLWGHEHELHCREDYCDDCDRIEGQRVRDNRITNARRGSSERYDFRMRKYREPDVGTWSGVRFCGVRAHTVPREYRDIQGRSYPGNQWHNSVHGAHTD